MNCLKILNRLTTWKGQGGGKARVFKARGEKCGGICVWVRVKKIKKAREKFPHGDACNKKKNCDV